MNNRPQKVAAMFLFLLLSGGLATASAGQETAADAFREGAAAQGRGDLERAVEAYERALKLQPRLAEAHANLGAVLARLGRQDEAVAAYERALAINPRLTAARLNLGLAHYRAGVLSAAAEAFQIVFDSDPTLLQGRQLLGLVLVELGRDVAAIPHLQASLSAAPDEPAVLFALGRAYARLDDSRAADIADRLATIPEGRPLWHHLRGLVLQRDDRHQPALQAFEAARALNAGLPQISVSIGVSRLALGDRAGARQAFGEALARSSEDAAPHVYLAWLDEQEDRLPEARVHAERAVALEGDLPESRGLLGRILLKQGQPEEAARHLEAAAALKPRDASWRFLLGQAYQRLGRAPDAAREFAEARQLKEQEVARERTGEGRIQ